MTGRLIAVVGPSGVGKDSVMEGVIAARPGLRLAQRVITRDAEAGGEDFRPATVEAFLAMQAQGAFCLSWQAHGLHYGIRAHVLDQVAEGADLLVNLSRSVLSEAQALCPGFTVLSITAKPETLARRLAGRGRETADDIAKRLARASFPLPEGVTPITISNDGPLSEAVADALAALWPAPSHV